ncbi:MAG: glycoside hydrolase family 3 C-terminal domain-containing protein, partial [Blautia sp.]|nr:glycoside hydrolase family 3 C-terminal domain-containing protein [Blautia sp.]
MKEKELRELMGELSLEEKVMQLVQLPGQAYMTDVTITGAVQENADERMKYLAGATLSVGGAEKVRKIQEQYMARHPHHIPLLFMMDVIHGYRTIFPCPLGQGATFDPELSRAAAAVQAKEARADGIQVTFSPMADLVRDARWGRVMESPGEDPYLNSRMTEAMVKGYQGEDIKVNVASCVKHFAAYGGAQAGRDYTNVELSEHTLRNQYLPAYEAGIKAGARLVMTSFNTWNGLPATANPYLMKDILRGEMGFDGVLISDWGAVGELEVHGVAEDLKEAAILAMEAGVDMDMCSGSYMHHLLSLVEEGHISIECLDAAVWRILKLKNDLGLFEDPFHGAASSDEEAEGVFLSKESRELARRAVAESVVLLENAGDLLPLSKDQRIGLLGPYAMSQELNSFWAFTGHTEDCVSLYEGANEEGYTVRAAKGALMVPNGTVLGTEVFETKENESDLLSEAMEVADWADTLVLCLGEPKGYSGESTSRTSLCIPKGQMELLSRAKKTGKKVVTLLFSGRPLVVGEIKELSDALLACFLPGT